VGWQKKQMIIVAEAVQSFSSLKPVYFDCLSIPAPLNN